MKILTKKLFILIGISGPIFYFVLLTILGLLWEGYDPISTGMSEIGALDSPFKDIMNFLGFSLLGMTIVLFSFGFRSYFGNSLLIRIAHTLLLLGGFVMFLIGFFPCDEQCIDVTQTGRFHSLASLITAILIPLGLVTSANSISKKWNKAWGYASFYMGVLSMAGGPIMYIEQMNNYAGLVQRLGISFSLLWIVLVSLKIYHEIRA